MQNAYGMPQKAGPDLHYGSCPDVVPLPWEWRGHDINRIVAAALVVCFLLTACSRGAEAPQRKPEQAGQPLNPVKVAARIAATRAAAMTGNQQAVQANMHAFNEDFRKSLKLADPARRVDRESARAAAKHVDGVRSVAWVDNTNLLAIVSRNEARSYDTIDAICMELEPLGDTLGVVVHLQSGAALSGSELQVPQPQLPTRPRR